ncbi:hypothetical protein J6590_066586 [Homalodisca vitripennis]|nr:hypothetical protein J6590_066586 [Homalodisca vitripennis]
MYVFCQFAFISVYINVVKLHYLEENDNFFTGNVRYGISHEDAGDKIGNHPVTYDDLGNIIIKILAKPNASKNMIGVCTKCERLGLRIAAPPVDGKANKEMLKFLASTLGIRRSALSITEDNGELKTVKVDAGTIFMEESLTKLMDAQYMKTSYIGHPDYFKINYIDD